MTARRYHSSRPNEWVQPRPRSGLTREYVHGKGAIKPMDYAERPGHIVPRLRRLSAWLTYGALIALAALTAWHGVWAMGRVAL